jgi:hypothetical protein
VGEGEILRVFKELRVLRVGPRPSSLYNVNPKLIEFLGYTKLVPEA